MEKAVVQRKVMCLRGEGRGQGMANAFTLLPLQLPPSYKEALGHCLHHHPAMALLTHCRKQSPALLRETLWCSREPPPPLCFSRRVAGTH